MKLVPKALSLVSLSSVIWMEGDGNYTRVHFVDGKVEILPYTLKVLENKLPTFVRVHKSSLVNPLYIGEFSSRGYRDYYVKLKNGHVLSVSRKRLEQTAEQLNMNPHSNSGARFNFAH